MKLGLGVKLFLTALALIGTSVLVADLWLGRETDAYLTAMVEDDLAVRAHAAAREVGAQPFGPDEFAKWDELADAEGKTLEARVTLMRADGVVAGDSEVAVEGLAAVENHKSRPEMSEALEGRVGQSTRLSATVKYRLLYVAVPVEKSPVAVVRIAKPLESVDKATAQVRGIIWSASALALAIAAVLSGLVARRVSRAVGDVTSAARKMTTGDLSVRTRVRGNDEISELGQALDTLAENLAGTLTALKGERDLQSRILEGMQEGVLVVSEDDRVVVMNPALRDMLLLGSDPAGQMFLEVVRHAELHEILEHARAGEPAAGDIEVAGIKPRHLRVHVSPLGGDASLLAVFVDVTDLKRLESLRRDFVANVSHELRTPVAAVKSATETLEQGALKDPIASARFVSMISRNAQRLQDLIEDLLELSKLDAKELRLKKESVDATQLATIVSGVFRERAEKKGVKLGLRLLQPTPALETDPRALEQILTNLVDNAIKYCPSGASVTIAITQQSDGRIRFAVEDTGPGIDKRHLPRLFERFYRVDAGRSRDVGGTGLGLSIVKHLAEALGGKLGVESEVGKGSTFWVDLPTAVTHSSHD